MTTSSTLPVRTRRTLAAVAASATALALVAGALLAPGAAGAATGLSTVRLATGQRVVDGAGNVWRSDSAYAAGGTIRRTTHHISGTSAQSLYRSERVGRFAYAVPVAPGYYRVTLSMAEQVYRRAGQRTFQLAAEGTTRMSRVDASRNGRWHVYAVTVTVRVGDGVLDLRLTPRRHAAAVSAIWIRGYRTLEQAPQGSQGSQGSGHPVTPPPRSFAPVTAPPATTPPATTPPTTTPPATTPPAATPPVSTPPAAGVVTPEQFGARGDGTTDDTAALQAAFDQAAGREVLLPAGKIYAHSNLLHLRTAGLHVSGPGQLLATNEQESSVWIEADNVLLDGGLVVRTGTTTQRWGTWDQMGIRVDGHSGVTLRSITVDGAAAAGIYVGGTAHNYLLDHVTVQNTRADGIHMTDGSYNGTVIAPTVINSGDDGVAIVSYSQDGPPCHDITVTSPRVLGTAWGRGLSVVGGTNITETDIDVERSSAAGVYIGAEGNPWYTAAATNVTISGGTIVGANTDTSVDHGAVLVLSGESDVAPSNVVVQNLSISNTRATVTRDLGVITYGSVPSNILFSGITIKGGPSSAYQGNTPQTAYRLRSIVQNGVRLPDAG